MDLLSARVHTALDAAGVPRAQWNEEGEVTHNGYRLMLSGSGVEVGYVDKPHVLEQHEAEIDRLEITLIEDLDDQQMELDGHNWRAVIRRRDDKIYGWSEINVVDLFWLSKA